MCIVSTRALQVDGHGFHDYRDTNRRHAYLGCKIDKILSKEIEDCMQSMLLVKSAWLDVDTENENKSCRRSELIKGYPVSSNPKVEGRAEKRTYAKDNCSLQLKKDGKQLHARMFCKQYHIWIDVAYGMLLYSRGEEYCKFF